MDGRWNRLISALHQQMKEFRNHSIKIRAFSFWPLYFMHQWYNIIINGCNSFSCHIYFVDFFVARFNEIFQKFWEKKKREKKFIGVDRRSCIDAAPRKGCALNHCAVEWRRWEMKQLRCNQFVFPNFFFFINEATSLPSVCIVLNI